MAQSIFAAPATTAMDVHVTGRRVLATIVDGIVLGVLFAVISILFGDSSTSGTSVSFSREPSLLWASSYSPWLTTS